MAENKTTPQKQAGTARNKIESSWTIRGVSQETKRAAVGAAKEKGVPIGQWVDEALSEAVKAPPGAQLLSTFQDLRSRAEPTLEQMRSRTDETLEKWRAGLLDQVGNTLDSIQRLQKQLLGRQDEEGSTVQQPAADYPIPGDASKTKTASSNTGKGKRTKRAPRPPRKLHP